MQLSPATANLFIAAAEDFGYHCPFRPKCRLQSLESEGQGIMDALENKPLEGSLPIIVSSGKTIPWTEMRKYLEARVSGKSAKRPVARKLAR